MFRIDWLDFLAVQDSQESSPAVRKYQLFGTQPSLWSHLYMTTGKTIALTRRTFVGKVMSLLFNMLSRWGNSGNSVRLYFLGSKITADGDCSHESKRRLLLGRKIMTNIDSIFKSRDITLPTKVHLVKAMVFPVVMYGCESWTVKKAEC